MNAVIKVGGKQYYVQENQEIYIEKLDAEAKDTVKFDQVLMLDSKIGNPYLTNVTVDKRKLKFSSISQKTDLIVRLKGIDNLILR